MVRSCGDHEEKELYPPTQTLCSCASMAAHVNLLFAINGERFELSNIDPSTTLLEFLRTQTRYRGAKLGCGEGGCGACVVLLSTYDPVSEDVKEFTVSSCLTLLCSIHLCSVTTTEGLGNSRNGFHSIHQRFSGFHASQCGFCTPGMCMSLFSALVNAEKTQKLEPRNGFSKLTVSKAEKAIICNLCRCTGYRPIIDACKSFASDVDLEDLGLNSFWKKGEKDASFDKLPVYSRDGICTFPNFLKIEITSSLECSSSSLKKDATNSIITQPDLAEGCWYRPASIDELYKQLNSEHFKSAGHMKMVVGNTGSGFYKELDLWDKYIDLKGIQELSVIRRDDKGIELGAAVTISKAIEVLEEEGEGIFTKIAHHMNKVASEFVRNTASLGGNLIMAQRNEFPSDIATVLLAVDATVSLCIATERLVLTLEEFLEMPPCDERTLLLSIFIPSWNKTDSFIDSKSRTKSILLFETYRAASRPLGNSLAYLNSAFLAQISFNKITGDLVLDNVRLAFGAYGTQHAIRATKVEEFLKGKTFSTSVLLEAIRILREIIIPKEDTRHPAYRSSLAVVFLFNFLGTLNDRDSPDKALNYASLDRSDDRDLLLSSKQVVGCSMDYHPVGEPAKKDGAEIQASGEAVYVDDIPSPKDCLYGAFIYSTRPLAHIESIKFNSTPAAQKVATVVSVKDIPNGGQNIGASTMFGSEPLFANSLTECAGQPLGVVIAESQRFANIGAKQAIVDYSTENLAQPILSVEEAVRKSSYFEVPPFIFPKQVGDFSKGMEEADHKIYLARVELGSQYYFYMETQTALAIPDEDNCMIVYSSTQCPEETQGVIAKCLGIPQHNVRVITRRVGGGFGGKALRSMPVATACALAAYKLRRPVRMYLDRQTDMIMAGGRHPMKIKYSVGFKSDGKITALHVDILINAGISPDVSAMMPHTIIASLKKYNWGALSFDIKVCKTNLPSKSAMRAPGEVQGSFIAEAVIEHVASALSIDAIVVREKNFHTFESLMLFYGGSAGEEASEYTLPDIFNKLASSSSYDQRVAAIRGFNYRHRWVKRGISCTPVVVEVSLRPTPGKVGILQDGSIVVEVGGIEIGQGLWTKVKQMTAFSLGQIWGDAKENLLERVRVVQADTLSLIQGGWTAGSTTSESSCEAVRLACNSLVERLRPLKNTLEKELGLVTWDTLIGQACLQAVNLSASAYWVPQSNATNYLNFGAAVSEVEVDLLTGATMILRSDLIYDCGQSLNPGVDLGQIEGAFVQGIGFFMNEEYLSNSDGLVVSEGTWTYKVPTVDTIPKQFNVEILNSGHHKDRVLSSKASGEPPLLLAVSVHCATREAIRAAREESASHARSEGPPSFFQLAVPATMPVVKELCGLDNVERYLESCLSTDQTVDACNHR